MINAYLTDDVVLHVAGVKDKFGTPGADAEVRLKGRVNIGTVLVKDIKGENVYSSMSVLLASRTISHQDFLEYDGKEYAILSIKKSRDFGSWGFLEVFLK
jgi:hypothetical protein